MGSLCKHVGYIFHRYKRTQIYVRSPWFQHEIGTILVVNLFREKKEIVSIIILYFYLIIKDVSILFIGWRNNWIALHS